jgi:hypothetical protein
MPFCLDNLRKRELILINRCCLCKSDGEAVDHILLHSEVASALWYAFFSHFGLTWVMPNSVANLFAWTGGHSRVLWCGRWSFFVLCGVCGGKEM